MRKIIVFENVSLDGFMAGPNGELDWATRDDEIARDSQARQEPTGHFLFGRVTYEMMASFWPTPAGKAASPIFAQSLNNTPKIVFSNSLQKADWQHTEVMKDINQDEILRLKNQPGGDMMIFGSGTVVSRLARLGLVDEYQLVINPVILGKGMPLFKDVTEMIRLKLVKTKTFRSGIVLLQYQPEEETAD